MNTQLITTGNFKNIFEELINNTQQTINIISPFIGEKTAYELSEIIKNKKIKCRIITRFYREDFISQVSSITGLKYLHDAGAEIVALIRLHTKLYVFDDNTAIIGSANFTTGGFYTNHELSVLIKDNNEITKESVNHFNELWERIEENGQGLVTKKWIDKEIESVDKQIKSRNNKPSKNPNSIRKGAILSYEPYAQENDRPDNITARVNKDILEQSLDSSNGWLKFVGSAKSRFNENVVYTSTERSFSKVYLSYQKTSAIKVNDIMYIVAHSEDKNKNKSTMVVGKAIVGKELSEDKNREDKYRCYFELKQSKYVDTVIRNTVNLKDIYKYTNFNKSYNQQPYISIDDNEVIKYLDKKLDELFEEYGYTYIN